MRSTMCGGRHLEGRGCGQTQRPAMAGGALSSCVCVRASRPSEQHVLQRDEACAVDDDGDGEFAVVGLAVTVQVLCDNGRVDPARGLVLDQDLAGVDPESAEV